jgi:hypothetical protein
LTSQAESYGTRISNFIFEKIHFSRFRPTAEFLHEGRNFEFSKRTTTQPRDHHGLLPSIYLALHPFLLLTITSLPLDNPAVENSRWLSARRLTTMVDRTTAASPSHRTRRLVPWRDAVQQVQDHKEPASQSGDAPLPIVQRS